MNRSTAAANPSSLFHLRDKMGAGLHLGEALPMAMASPASVNIGRSLAMSPTTATCFQRDAAERRQPADGIALVGYWDG